MDRPSIKDLMENITFEKLPAAVAAIYEKLEQIEDLVRIIPGHFRYRRSTEPILNRLTAASEIYAIPPGNK